MTTIHGSAHDTTVKSTVLDAHAHLCLLASNALHVVKKKVNFRCDFRFCDGVPRPFMHPLEISKRSSGCRLPFDKIVGH